MTYVRKVLTAIAALTMTGLISACGADRSFDGSDPMDATILGISDDSAQIAGALSLTEATFNTNVKPLFLASCDRCHSAPTFAESVALSIVGDPANSPIYQRATGTLHHRVVWRTTSPEAAALSTWLMGQ